MCSYKAMKLVPRMSPCMCMRAGNLQLRSEEHSCTLNSIKEKCTLYTLSEDQNVKIKSQIHEQTLLVNFKTMLVMKESTDFSMEKQHIFTARLCRTPRRVPSCHRVVEPNGPGDRIWISCLDEMLCFSNFFAQKLICELITINLPI